MPIIERVSTDLPATLKTASYALVANDNGTEIQFQSVSAVAANLPAVIEVANGYNAILRNIGSGTLTVTPATGETIDGAASLALAASDWRWIRNDGTEWKSISVNPTIAPVTGSWTPVISFETPGDLSVTYSVQVGAYMKIGDIVTVTFNVTVSSFTYSTASGDFTISGLPFASESVANQSWIGSMYWGGITKANYTDVAPRVPQGVAAINLAASGSGQPPTAITAADVPSGAGVNMAGTITYKAA